MAKLLKRISMFLFMFAMAFVTFMPMKVKAEEEKTVVYVKAPEDWSAPCLWAWDEEGNNAFAAWPGGEMEQDKNNEGWYYIWIPSWADHFIVSANEAEVQTGEIISEGGNAWITIEDAETTEISYDALTQGEIPAYVEKFEVHVKVPDSWKTPCLWAESEGTNEFEAWPGEALKAGENGWYTGKAPVWVKSIVINGNDGAVQTEDIAVDPAQVWVTVEEDGSYDFSYNDPDAVEVPDINVYVKAPADWENVCMWAWSAPDGTNAFASWPGEALAEGENGWLTIKVPGWINSIIVNANEGNVQTTDISVETGKDVWILVTDAEEYEVSYEEPAADESGAEAEETEGADTEEVDSEEAAEESGQIQEAESRTNTGIIVVVVIICVIIAALAVFFVIRKKK